jgi:hypothetical protein
VGTGSGVIVVPGVLSMASDYAAFASALAENFSVHTLERRAEAGVAHKPMATAFKGKLMMCSHCTVRQTQVSWWATATVDWLPWRSLEQQRLHKDRRV